MKRKKEQENKKEVDEKKKIKKTGKSADRFHRKEAYSQAISHQVVVDDGDDNGDDG